VSGTGPPGGSGPPPRPPWAYVGLGFEIVVPIVLGLLAGWWLDERWGTGPWLMMAGVLLGIGAGFYNFFRVVLPPKA
jgi:F0F1-type ATP synthase assembly protein I